MASYNQENDIVGGGGYGWGAGGGMFAMIILLVVVFWVLFRGDRDGHKDGYGYGSYGCGPCVQPTFKDESNYEEESHLKDKLCCMDRDIWNVDQDVWKTACETQKEVHCEGEKTRALIEQNYIQDLRDKLTESQMCNMTLKQEMFTDKKFDQVFNQFCKTDAAIAALSCELPKRPPVFSRCDVPCLERIPDHRCEGFRDRDDFRRRGRCNDFGFDCGCCE